MNIKKLTIKETFLLAVENHKRKNLDVAEKLYIEILNVNPNHVETIFLLGSLSAQTNNLKEALIYYKKVLLIEPNHKPTINSLSILLSDKTKLNYIIQVDRNIVKELLLILFRRKDIDHNDIFLITRFLLLKEKNFGTNEIKKKINSNSLLLKNEIIQKLIKEELFVLMLQKSLMADYLLEEMLIKIRSEVLSILTDLKNNTLMEFFNFIISLAEQCFLNEYIYPKKKEEGNYVKKLKNSVENNNKVNELEIAILGCYFPLYCSESITKKLLSYKSTNILFNDLILMQIKEPLRERKLVNSIKSLGHISDRVSKKVRNQYEENPYPRWRYTYANLPVNSLTIINSLIQPNKVKTNNNFNNPNVLIAGCGTGKQILLSKVYLNANILGVDLSLSSLAYAKRKVEELNLKNINFLHSDILKLKSLNKKFDIIECAGVLHHMDDPLRGLKILTELLEPEGFMRLGLYSEIARQDIIKIREFIKKNNYKNTIKDIQNCRKEIAEKKKDKLLSKVLYRKDFYSTSSARDLMFHVQEHRFTLKSLATILKDSNLEFLGFNNMVAKKQFSKIFPEDKNSTSLDNWNKFEINNTDTFLGMYDFLVRKKNN